MQVITEASRPVPHDPVVIGTTGVECPSCGVNRPSSWYTRLPWIDPLACWRCRRAEKVDQPTSSTNSRTTLADYGRGAAS